MLVRAVVIALTLTLAVPAQAQFGSDEAQVKAKINQFLSRPDVQKTLDNLKDNLHTIHREADKATDGALGAAERAWKKNVDELITAYQKSDIPRKLKEGDWSFTNELMVLLSGKPLPDTDEEKQLLADVRSGKITVEEFLAALRRLYAEPPAPQPAAKATAEKKQAQPVAPRTPSALETRYDRSSWESSQDAKE
jgi:hypothetical protein